jgi:TRAP-type C4-dicarboxylate transport system permease small subunit
MLTGTVMGFLNKFALNLNRFLMLIGCALLILMISLTCANIFLRTIWVPIQGTYELMGYFGAVLTAFALGYTQIHRGHISVDLLVLGFSKKTQKALGGINDLVCMVFFGLVAWRITLYGTTLWRTGEVTETLRIVYYPFVYAVALGCATLSLIFLTDLLRSFFQAKEESP